MNTITIQNPMFNEIKDLPGEIFDIDETVFDDIGSEIITDDWSNVIEVDFNQD